MKGDVPVKVLLGLLVAVVLFHASIIAGVIPYDVTWGGRLENDLQMYVFETISIVINLFLGFLLLLKGGYIKQRFSQRATNILLWIFFALFVLNTIGNLFAETGFERAFSVLTLLFAVLIWMILKKKDSRSADCRRREG